MVWYVVRREARHSEIQRKLLRNYEYLELCSLITPPRARVGVEDHHFDDASISYSGTTDTILLLRVGLMWPNLSPLGCRVWS
jgi:hypothetical protein